MRADRSNIEPRNGRNALIAAITRFLSDRDAETLNAIRESLAREIDEAGPDALKSLAKRLAAAGADWTYYPRDPLTRRIHQVLANRILEADSTLYGIEHAAAVAGKPVVIFANHLSYSDANLLEILLQRAGGAELSDRLTVIAGPKVYSSRTRRFSSLCFGTINTCRVARVRRRSGHECPRGRARRPSMHRYRARASPHGEALLVFAEGARSRTRGMQEMLPGASRYLEGPDTWVLPVGIIGTEALFPIGEDTLHTVRIVARAGPAMDHGCSSNGPTAIVVS